MKEQRNSTFDILKGIGILCVIAGHSRISPFLTQFVFSFHMPLFFLVGGYFYKLRRTDKAYVQWNIRRLFYPYVFTCLIYIIYAIISRFVPQLERHGLFGTIIASLYGSGSPQNSYILNSLPMLGAIWFLPALFWCKLLYNILSNKFQSASLHIVVLAASIFAMLAHKIFSPPLSLFQGMTAVVFFHIGYLYRHHAPSFYMLIVCFICWCISICYSHINLVTCTMKLYPIDILGACGGTYFMYLLSTCIARVDGLKTIFEKCGVLSMPILCFHFLELHIRVGMQLHLRGIFSYIFSFAFPIIMSYLFLQTKLGQLIFEPMKVDNSAR